MQMQEQGADSARAVHAALTALGITFNHLEHEAVFTVDDSIRIHAAMPGVHTKNLFLKDAAGQFWLVSVPAEARVDLKALPAAVGSKRLSFAKAEDLWTHLGIRPGSVSPLAALNDRAARVTIVLDRLLASAALVNVHPLRNTATIGLAGSNLVAALRHWGHPPAIIDVPQMTGADSSTS